MVKAHVQARIELEQTEAAFERVRQRLIEQLIATKIGESDLRDKIVLTIQALEAVKAELIAVVHSGDIEEYAEEVRAQITGD